MNYSRWVRLQPAIFAIGVGLVVLASIAGGVAWATGGLQGVLGHPGEQVAREFMEAITTGHSDRAIDLICPRQGGGVILVVAVNMRWDKANYTGSFEDNQSGVVRVTGSVNVRDQDFDQFIIDVVELYKWYGRVLLYKIPGPEMNMSGRLDVDFDQLAVSKNSDGWCVEYESLFDFYEYLIKLATQTFEVQS